MKASKIVACMLCMVFLSCLVSSAQIIVLNDTEEKTYSLEEVVVSGDLETNTLKMEGRGEVISGTGVKVYLFGPSSDVLVRDLSVNDNDTPVSFDGSGYFFVSEKGAFSFEGALDIKTLGQIKLYARGPANKISFKLKNGYAVGGDVFGAYNKQIVLQRSEKAQTLVTGSFKYTYAERNSFLYLLNFQAFGSSLGGYTVDLPNGETVSGVSGAYKWEQQGTKLLLDLESDKATVTVSGIFNSQNLKMPLPDGRNIVLIESDPEKKISISTYAQEVDLSESPLNPTYSNARAFLSSNRETFGISLKTLDVAPSLAASVSRATNKIAVTDKGSIVGELSYRYSNTGVDYILIDVDATPLYASTANSPVKLTREDELMLSFPKGEGKNLDFVYFTTRNPLAPIDTIELPLAKTDLPITTAYTQIYLPKDYFVLWTFGADGGSELPSFEFALMFLVVVSLIGYALRKDKLFVACYLIFAAGLFVFNAFFFMLLFLLSLVELTRRHLKIHGGALVGAAVLIAVLVGLSLLFLVLVWQLGVFNVGQGSSVYYESRGLDMDEAASAPAFKGLEQIGSGEGAITVPTRTGVLPVKLEIPSLGKQISVTNYLVTKENPLEIKILVVADYFKYVLYLISALAFVKAYLIYRRPA